MKRNDGKGPAEPEQIRLVSTMDILDGFRKVFEELSELDGKEVKLNIVFILYDFLKKLELASAENLRYCTGGKADLDMIDPGRPGLPGES